MKLKRLLQQETVLIVAILLAVISSFFVHPDRKYMDYIDFRTLAVLFSLMTVMAGLQRQGVFDRMGRALTAHTGGIFRLVLVLSGLCFFGSMVITNDVALMTFVPFTFAVLSNLREETRLRLALPVVCMQTIAANLGSMLTPIGNPQNLYLYSKSGMSIAHFIGIMFPYTMVSLILLVAWAALLCHGKKENLSSGINRTQNRTASDNPAIVALYGILFVLCLSVVAHVVPYWTALAAVLFCTFCADRITLRRVDYSLLLTFIAFFIFIGNIGRIPAFSAWLQQVLSGREVPVAVFASQVTSNVPAALLLSGFTENTEALVIGTNLGGLGTLIASMASLISYRQIAREMPQEKGRYFRMFTISNLVFLAVLLAEWAWLVGN